MGTRTRLWASLNRWRAEQGPITSEETPVGGVIAWRHKRWRVTHHRRVDPYGRVDHYGVRLPDSAED